MKNEDRVIHAAEVRELVTEGYTDWRDLVRVAVRAYERIFSPHFYVSGMNRSRHMPQQEVDAEVERVWSEFWEPMFVEIGATPPHATNSVIENFTEQTKRELYDWHNAMSLISEAYCDLTGGRVSKPFTDPRVVVDFAQETFNHWRDIDWFDFLEAIAEERRAELGEAGDVISLSELIAAAREDFPKED